MNNRISRAEWFHEAKWGVFMHFLAAPASSSQGAEIDAETWNRHLDKVPVEYHEEFAQTLVENETAVEINFVSCLIMRGESITPKIDMLMPPGVKEAYIDNYVQYLDFLKRRGVTFSLGSDCGAEIVPSNYEPAWKIMDALGIDPEKLWHPPASKTWRRNSPKWKENYLGRTI